MRCSQPFRSKFQIVYINEILADLLLKTTHQQHSRWTDWHFIYNKQRNMWVGQCFSSWWHHVWLRYWTPIAINMCMHMPHWQGKGGGGCKSILYVLAQSGIHELKQIPKKHAHTCGGLVLVNFIKNIQDNLAVTEQSYDWDLKNRII